MRPHGVAVLLAAAGFAVPATAQDLAAIDLFTHPGKGHCIACHQLPAGTGPESRNDVGPRLEGARMRELGREALREILRDPTRNNPETVMPPYGRHRLLDEREIDRLAEFLHALP
jgi:sulfur-oxidizing protein SoxX